MRPRSFACDSTSGTQLPSGAASCWHIKKVKHRNTSLHSANMQVRVLGPRRDLTRALQGSRRFDKGSEAHTQERFDQRHMAFYLKVLKFERRTC